MDTQIKTLDNTLNTKKTLLATTLLTGMAMTAQLQADVFKANFNGYYKDMVWGMPFEDVADVMNAGRVKVV